MYHNKAYDCPTYDGPPIGGGPLLDFNDTLSWMTVKERCQHCRKLYTVSENLGSWECWGHPGEYRGKKGSISGNDMFYSDHGYDAWSCCGLTKDPNKKGYDFWSGCTRQDHSATGVQFVKKVPGSVVKLTYLEIAAIPRERRNELAFFPRPTGVFLIRYDYRKTEERLRWGQSAEELNDPNYVVWDYIRAIEDGRLTIAQERTHFGGAAERAHALLPQHCLRTPTSVYMKFDPRRLERRPDFSALTPTRALMSFFSSNHRI